jgi:hypothetical protein
MLATLASVDVPINFRCPATRGFEEYASAGMVDAVVDDNVLEIEGAQPREAGDIDAELIGIGSTFMMGIDAAFRAKEMFGRTCVEFIDRQRLDARQNLNAAEIGGDCNGSAHPAV